jgi:ankyrin repeat protein
MLAAGYGRLTSVQSLIDCAKLDINSANSYGDTALHRAACWGRTDVIKFLLDNGANDSLKNNAGQLYGEVLKSFEQRRAIHQYM